MGLPGTYISIQKTGGTEYIVPYSDAFGFSCSQQWFTPLEELYQAAKGMIQESLESVGTGATKIVSGGIEMVDQGMRLLGVKLFNKAFLAKAWEKSDPISLTVNLKFFYGMKDEWNGQTEVYKPIMEIMGATVPKEGSAGWTISAPGPNALNVYAYFGAQLFSFLKTVDKTGSVEKAAGNISRSANGGNDITTGTSATTFAETGLWTLKMGYSKSGSKIDLPYYTLSSLIVKSSSFTLSSEVDQNGAPINGTISLTLDSQTLIVNSDFIPDPVIVSRITNAGSDTPTPNPIIPTPSQSTQASGTGL